MTTSQYPQKTLNWKAIIFWGLVIGLICFAIYQYRTPIIRWIQKPSFDLSWLQNLSLDKIVTFIKDYGVLFSAAGLGITFIYGIYQKHQANKAALQLVTAQQNANSEISTAYSTAEQYKQQAETYKTQLENTQTSL